ncbi:nucleotidyltransferase domain-containing protein [Chitinophaga qingshengii]|uniref:Nucleotidyltransferase domain-containing protein n=1 Tax=Chitinophaga qingshengii TaxID=1569794 RepID=A0ABR7TKQ1_9BACT|nr:nucleotidyltransferase domain-containing protein [Chitinophaga qingshengii]MBC9931039.1 nucleotidyltransferase domain-containing protein [Chitinophaga qingshengii]
MNLSEDKLQLLTRIAEDLRQVEGVEAIVLGGSYAAGMATEQSDLDIGIYYHAQHAFDTNDIKTIVERYAVSPATVTAFYEWGPWVNGGAWMMTEQGKVDFLYRNIDQVQDTIDKAQRGEWENHYEQQPPYGFSSVIYLAEISICRPLYDHAGILAAWKQVVATYPPRLRETIVRQSLWSAEFTLWQTAGFAEKQDVYNTVGCLARAVKNLVAAVFAINERYPLGDKRVMEQLQGATKIPPDFNEKIDGILSVSKNTISQNVAQLQSLHSELVQLSDGLYKPLYQL